MESNQVLTFTVSILVHLLLLVFVQLYNPVLEIEKKELSKWLEFTPPPPPENIPSEKTQRVKRQTRVRNTSPIQSDVMPTELPSENRSSLGSLRELQDRSYGASQNAQQMQTSSGDLFVNQAARITEAQRIKIQGYLPPDIEIGDMVALNTDQDLYYTFYRRMAEKVIWPWVQSITASVEKMRSTGQLGNSSKAWITILEVLLDRNGNVIETQPLQLAGEYDIDSAPVRAFKNAKNFPNPPVEMIEEDGYIRIRYKFLVYYRPM